jgi:hypothetical protein
MHTSVRICKKTLSEERPLGRPRGVTEDNRLMKLILEKKCVRVWNGSAGPRIGCDGGGGILRIW